MFGRSRPRCPVDDAAKQWIESRLGWLAAEFGREVFTRRAVILPSDDFFPDPYDGAEASVRNLLNQVCAYMDVDPSRIQLEFFRSGGELWLVNDQGKALPSGAAGLYDQQMEKTVIHIEMTQAALPMDLVGTMAHELAHLRLMGERRVVGDEYDNELLTDLTAVFFGFGIFLGNSPRDWEGQYSLWPGTELRRPEYMSLPMLAYALAHAAWHRGQPKPPWLSFLSFDLKPSVKRSLRFLFETGDSAFAPA